MGGEQSAEAGTTGDPVGCKHMVRESWCSGQMQQTLNSKWKLSHTSSAYGSHMLFTITSVKTSTSEALAEVPLGCSRWREENHCDDRGHRDSADNPLGGEDQDVRAKRRISFKIPSHLSDILTSLCGGGEGGDR